MNHDEQQHHQPIYQNITNNNINVVHAEDGEIAPAQDDYDKEPPTLGQHEDSSDDEDEDYDHDAEEESSESEVDDSQCVEMVPEEEALEDDAWKSQECERSQSTRQIRGLDHAHCS